MQPSLERKQVQLVLLGPKVGAVFDDAGGEPVAVADAADALAQGILVGAAQVDTLLEGLAEAGGGEAGELGPRERKETLLGGAGQIERSAAKGHGAVIAGGAGHSVQRGVGIGDS